ncbi:hypothetical protein C8Z91_24000 [Paenibacillus elgii]|uniref:Uncharacterized protein n=1 Tax=Paenibacillus elgii TaxID=189691 RepID=A0A2T6FX32_9BACL|nr:hypothetical protein C8Z91_24000 [Paenibacillus elgii]
MSINNKVPTESKTWQIQLENRIVDVILSLCDLDGESFWNKVEEKNLSYFIRKSAGTPWGNHLIALDQNAHLVLG